MRTTLVIAIAVSLAALGIALALPETAAMSPCVGKVCLKDPCPFSWGCGPCDPSTQCCGPECEPM